MKSKNVVLLALAGGCGLVAAFLTAKLGAGSRQEMIPVLVAAKNLDQGAKLEKVEELFIRKPFPRESVPPEFIDDPAVLKGKTLQRSIRAGNHLTMADITPRTSIELPVDPKTGVMYKAMALRVAPETIVGGLVLPGSRVDVVTVERLPNGKTVSNMILQNVLVVGVDVNTQRPEDQGYIKNAQTVTLAVKQTEGMYLALAQKRGDVFLMLRSPDDDKINNTIKSVTDYNADKSESEQTVAAALTEKTTVLLAKETVTVGTRITDPEKYFVVSEWPVSAVKDNFVTRLTDLKDKVVQHQIASNTPPTIESFQTEENSPSDAKVASQSEKPVEVKPVQRHMITFQVGGAAPYYAHYRDGRLEEKPSAPSATETPGPKTPVVTVPDEAKKVPAVTPPEPMAQPKAEEKSNEKHDVPIDPGQ
jgi:Flp pilus assembly protein CpaB